MLLVLPYSKYDGDLALKVLEHMHRLGSLDSHECLLVHTPNAAEAEEQLVAEAERTFGKVGVFALPQDLDGWPQGPNYLFQSVAYQIAADSEPRGPWYFFEPDNTPMRTGWLDLLEQEYHENGKPFMGAVVPTRAFVKATGAETTMDSHMVGTGIYPQGFPNDSLLLPSAVRSGTPFDVYIQYELAPYCHGTDSIQHIWSVKNCRRENGQIVCDANAALSQPVPIREDALVVHGVKDGSLIDLLDGGVESRHAEIRGSNTPEDSVPPKDPGEPRLSSQGQVPTVSSGSESSASPIQVSPQRPKKRHMKRHSPAYMAARN